MARKCRQQTRHSRCTRHNCSSQLYNINKLSSSLRVSILPKLPRRACTRVLRRKSSAICYDKRNYFIVISARETFDRRHRFKLTLRPRRIHRAALQGRPDASDPIGSSSSAGFSMTKLIISCTASIVGNGVQTSPTSGRLLSKETPIFDWKLLIIMINVKRTRCAGKGSKKTGLSGMGRQAWITKQSDCKFSTIHRSVCQA
jgi:hypothetical protein